MKLHVYCVVEHTATFANPPHGIAGGAVRRVNTADVSFLVSDFPERAVPVTRENALAHAAVIQSVLRETTPLPFRFGTLVTEQELENYVTAKRQALRSKLEQVRGCVEMNVKIISEGEWIEEPLPAGTQEKPGTAFLSEKRREILGGEARAEEAKRVTEWLQRQVATVAKATQITTSQTKALLLTAAHLVERSRIDEFREKVTEARQQRPDLHFLTSGPWAPYSFTNMDLEFKTHFGVS
jgi:hypothetical protein